MKILFVMQHLVAAGPLRQLGTLVPALRERGHDVSLVGMHDVDTHWPDLYAGDVECVGRSVRRLRRHRPDVLYAYHGDGARLLSWLATRGTRTTLVWGVQGAARMRRTAAAAVCRSVSRTVPLLVASSESARTRYAAAGYRCRRMVTIAPGIDTELFRPDPQARAGVRDEWGIGDEPVVGVVARVDPGNPRHELVRDTAARLDPGIRVVLVGDGTPVDFRADMPAVYNAFDVLCSPSVWEGFPNSVAEAMACGVPCVVTDVGDSAAVVGDTGIVVPPGDPDRLAAGITELLARPRVPIETRFTVERCVRALERELDAAAGSSPPKSAPAGDGRRATTPPRARSRP